MPRARPAAAGPQCGSPRLVAYPERDALAIAHVDCDAFYAAVEKRDNPNLIDQPVIVGGGHRGVVSTACYIARTYGVRSAMPMFKACAYVRARVIRPNMPKYAEIGRAIRARMLELTPLVEPLSIDEAFVDLSRDRASAWPQPPRHAGAFCRSNRSRNRDQRLDRAKLLQVPRQACSDLDKPRGLALIGRAEAQDFLAPRPVGIIWGVGAKMQRVLTRGLRSIGDLRRIGGRELSAASVPRGGGYINWPTASIAQRESAKTDEKPVERDDLRARHGQAR